ncbi:hypothetical protein L915_07270 [Phytophthora nicotianae]|uniref:Uncharacterized protein n=1 Tax=Phytophthora nicotianae TaxID=4792 RepID=W2J890_PHYNI|nr:hypothetical protein L915_07270 [Phytophthora nicotianae]ETL41873.1 hypothetical protein L916_07216 [Phytophthora nicotianae]
MKVKRDLFCGSEAVNAIMGRSKRGRSRENF